MHATEDVTLDDLLYGDRLDRLVDEIERIDGVVEVEAGPGQPSSYLRITLDPAGHPIAPSVKWKPAHPPAARGIPEGDR